MGKCLICLEITNKYRCSTCKTYYHQRCQRKFSIKCCVCKTPLPIKGRVHEYKYVPDPPEFTLDELSEQRNILLEIQREQFLLNLDELDENL